MRVSIILSECFDLQFIVTSADLDTTYNQLFSVSSLCQISIRFDIVLVSQVLDKSDLEKVIRFRMLLWNVCCR